MSPTCWLSFPKSVLPADLGGTSTVSSVRLALVTVQFSPAILQVYSLVFELNPVPFTVRTWPFAPPWWEESEVS